MIMMNHLDDGHGFCGNCYQALIKGWETDECTPVPDLPGMGTTDRFRLIAIQSQVVASQALNSPAAKWLLQLLSVTARELVQATRLLTGAQDRVLEQDKLIERLTAEAAAAQAELRRLNQAAQGSGVI